MKKRIVGLSVLCLLLLTACSHGPSAPLQGPLSMLYSPNGEPLNGGPLGRPLCKEAYALWFQRLDPAHTGRIDEAAFKADAERVFAEIDAEKDGVLTAAELEKARFPYRQFASDPKPGERNAPSFHDHQRPEGHGENKQDRHDRLEQANGSQPDPIMAADTNLDFKVTHDEYRAQTAKTFAFLDHTHSGALSVKDLEIYCPE